MNIDIILLTKLSELAYLNRKEIYEKALELGFSYKNISFIDENDIRCIIFKHINNSIIVFRGSDNIENWVSNFKIIKTQTGKGKIHRGFLNYSEKLLPRIKKEIYLFSNIYITGHSLGAAIGNIIANNLYEDGYIKNMTGLFIECPNIFDKRYKKNTRHYDIHRIFIKNNIDLVKVLPPRWMNYTNYSYKDTENCDLIYFNRKDLAIINPSKTYILSDKFQTYINPINWIDGVTDHYMDYVLSLVLKNKEIIKELL